jgi:hypothetical protein
LRFARRRVVVGVGGLSRARKYRRVATKPKKVARRAMVRRIILATKTTRAIRQPPAPTIMLAMMYLKTFKSPTTTSLMNTLVRIVLQGNFRLPQAADAKLATWGNIDQTMTTPLCA